MLTLRKAWVWIKKHWYVPVLFVFVSIVTIFGALGLNRNKNLLKMLEINEASYKNQIKAIEKAHAEEIKRKEDLYNTYVSTMKKLEKDHKKSLDDLEEEKKIKLDSMVKKYKGTPEELAKELSEMFGVKYDK